MKNEIEKLYELAGILKECLSPCYINKTWRKTHDCPNCDNRKNYPPFTAEKQLEIFKMFCKRYLSVSQHVEENGDLCFGIVSTVGGSAVGFNKDFAECLAAYVNCLWQFLSEEEREEIRKILRG